MNKRKLKRKIREAYSAETPELLSKILASCEREPQEPAHAAPAAREPAFRALPRVCPAVRRAVACALCLLLFLSGLTVGYLLPSGKGDVTRASAETVVFLDVNPSIELQIDGENKVVGCLAGNTDAELILADLRLEGVDMNTALAAIVGSLFVNGYLSEDSNSILISVDNTDKSKTETLLTAISDKINAVFERSGLECSIIAQSVDTSDEELKQRAEENGISVGKMHLVDKMIGGIADIDVWETADLAHMSIKELNLLYSTRAGSEEPDDPFTQDIATGNVGGFVDQEDVLSILLSAISASRTDVERFDIKAKLERDNGTLRMVYTVSVKLKGAKDSYEFEVDCLSGEIVKTDDKLPDSWLPGYDGNTDTQPGIPWSLPDPFGTEAATEDKKEQSEGSGKLP